MYLIPFSVILKPTLPITRLKKWQIPRTEKAKLGPDIVIFVHGVTKCKEILSRR